MGKKDQKPEPSPRTNAVSRPASTAVGQPLDFAADAGKGTEGVDKASLAIPFLFVLQTNSPACEAVKNGGLGKTPGEFMNSVTNDTFERIRAIPVAFQRRYLAWAPRSQGGGFRGEHKVDDVEKAENPLKWAMKKDDKGKEHMTLPDGSILKDTRNHFVMLLDEEGGATSALISLSSTQIKKSRRLMSFIKSLTLKDSRGKPYNPPSFSHVYEFWTVKEENDQGKWFGIDFKMVGPVEDADVYNAAKAFHDTIIAGKIEVAPPVQEPTDDVEKF